MCLSDSGYEKNNDVPQKTHFLPHMTTTDTTKHEQQLIHKVEKHPQSYDTQNVQYKDITKRG